MILRAVIAFVGIGVFLAVWGVIAACIIASEESRKEEKELELWRYTKGCDYALCPGNCDKCDRNLPFIPEKGKDND